MSLVEIDSPRENVFTAIFSIKCSGLSPLRSILAVVAIGLALLFFMDAALFRGGVYLSALEPESYAGRFLAAVRDARSRPDSTSKPVLVLGDSRIAEGFSAKLANRAAPGLRFINAAVPGASLRAMFYILREADPGRRRFSRIVLPVDDYDDEDGPLDRADISTDLPIVIPAFRLKDIPEFASSYRSWSVRFPILRDALFKGLVYRDDLRAFLHSPPTRLQSARNFEAHGSEWRYNYEGNPSSLQGLAWDARTRSLHFPPNVAPSLQTQLNQIYQRPPSPQTGRYKLYRRYWLGRLIQPYLSGPTRIAVIRLPRNPLPAPHYAPPDPGSAIRSLRSIPAVAIEDEHAFDSLEQPAFFADGLHLNAAGRKLFSVALAKRMSP